MRSQAVMLAIALSAAGVTALLARSWLDHNTPQAETAAAETISVLVVARNVAAGAPLQPEDLRYDNWPATLAAPRLLLRTGQEDGRAAFAGQIARRAMSEGEPFSAEAVARRENSGVMAAMLSPGMRAVSIAISNPTAVSGFITPGDQVDVLMAADLARTVENNRPPATEKLLRFSAETILSNVRVLAIDQQVTRSADGSGVQGKTATLEVTPKQAEILTVAGLVGALQLVLHGRSETALPLGREFSGDVEVSAALRSLLTGRSAPPAPGAPPQRVLVNRAGALSSEGFAQ